MNTIRKTLNYFFKIVRIPVGINRIVVKSRTIRSGLILGSSVAVIIRGKCGIGYRKMQLGVLLFPLSSFDRLSEMSVLCQSYQSRVQCPAPRSCANCAQVPGCHASLSPPPGQFLLLLPASHNSQPRTDLPDCSIELSQVYDTVTTPARTWTPPCSKQ